MVHTGRADGYLDYFNSRWLNYVGATLDDVCGRQWQNFIHPDDLDGHLIKWRAAIASGEQVVSETRVRCADGEYPSPSCFPELQFFGSEYDWPFFMTAS